MKWKFLLAVWLALLAPEVLAQGCPPPPNIPVGSCAPKTGTPTNFAHDSGPVRVRKSIYKLTPAEITELQLAFKRLRDLPSTDPRAWLAQANVHCWYCAGDASTLDDVHVTWAFMPWHRNYLYVFEKILGKLVGNPKFALPYWDWNTPDTTGCTGHLRVPPPYLGDRNTNKLVDCYRGISAASTLDVARVGAARVDDILARFNTFPLFFGSATTAAALWPGPHGYVHLFVGDPINLLPPVQDMGVLETAARDPLFWAHHANIDRLWDVWIARHGKPAYPSDFLEQSWTFWNQDQKLVRLTAADAAKPIARLKYRYDPPCGPSPVAEAAGAEEEIIALTPQPQTFRLEAKPARRKFTIGAETGTHVIVNLEEVTAAADQGAILRVYVNRPNATAESASEAAADSRLVEELFIVPSRTPGTGHHHQHQHSLNIKIVLPEEIAAEVEAAGGAASVTVVPVAATPEGALEAVPERIDVKMKRPYISVE